FADSYKYVCEKMGWNERDLLIELMELLDTDKRFIIFRAPTGYGKSTISFAIYYALFSGNRKLGNRIIHVLPLRTIGDDMGIKMRYFAHKTGIKYDEIAVQHMGVNESPLFAHRFVITTLDTFVLSLYKLPPFEIEKAVQIHKSHFEVPRGFIMSSIVVFDEFHLYSIPKVEKSNDNRTFTTTIATLISLAKAGVPLVLSTATLPTKVEEVLKRRLKLAGVEFEELSRFPKDSIMRSVNVNFTFDPIRDAIELSKEKSVLLMRNEVKDAIDTYRELKSKNVETYLLHSRIAEIDRHNIFTKIIGNNNRKVKIGIIIVSTQVMEAGVDLDFDALITDPAPPDSVIQRSGRVARYGGDGDVLITDKKSHVYDEKLVTSVYNYLNEKKNINDELLNIYDEFLKNEEYIDRNLFSSLIKLNDEPIFTASTALYILSKYCNLVRNSDLIPIIPKELYELHTKEPLSKITIAIDRDKLEELYKNKKIIGILTSEGELKIHNHEQDIERLLNTKCISISMLKDDINAFLIEGYDKEVGLP
ncbi:MAG: CRISPR-associated helicase Cas3', partial [Thermoprotei archaeon]